MSTNLSKQKREALLEELRQLRAYLAAAPQDGQTARLLGYLADLEQHVNGKKFGLIFEAHREEIDEVLAANAPVLTEEPSLFLDHGGPLDYLIEGDNLAALQLLQKTHRGKVDVIYIDPPYNTGASNWMYDNDYVDSTDTFQHSKWLSMMRPRLAAAKTLLTPQGVLICAIDENECATLRLLLEEIFGQGYEYDCVTIVHNPRGIQGKNFSYTNEFAYFVIPKGEKRIGDRRLPDEEVRWSPLRNWGSESLRSDAKNCFYPIYVKDGQILGFGPVLPEEVHPRKNEPQPDGSIAVYPIDAQGVERKWRYARQSVEKIRAYLAVKETKEGCDIVLGKTYGTYKTVWADPRYDANRYGKQLLRELLPGCPFDFPKSLWNVYDCLYAVVGKQKDATILDFFAGSGTTGHAVMQLNADDGGHRRFLLCTNNENGICRDVTYARLRRAMEKEGYAARLRYCRVDYVPTAGQLYYEYADALLAQIRPLIELENGGSAGAALAPTEEALAALLADPARLAACRTLYLGQDVLPDGAQAAALAQRKIEVRIVPDYYYRELQEG